MKVPVATGPIMWGDQMAPGSLPWSWVVERLERAHEYWIATTRPNGQPHCRPVWAAWRGEALYFSTGSLAAANLDTNPEITVHLESGIEVVILEGTAARVRDRELLQAIVATYNSEYDGYLDPETLPGPFYSVRPRVVFAWIAEPPYNDGTPFHGTATRWRLGIPKQSALPRRRGKAGEKRDLQ
jgi:nitroimidazol reductase NimA-like FMN-containing flavoprotein (pyridoxamine 5'-phosphate oxidase superfamily)